MRPTMTRELVAVRVVDASALVELFLRTALGRSVASELRGHSLVAPAHVDAEVLSAIGRLVRAKELPASHATTALRELSRAPIRRWPIQPLLEPSWNMRKAVALRDAIYVTLARRLEASLVTTDRSLSRVSGLGVTITLVDA